MSEIVVRPALPGEYEQVGELTVEAYVDGGLVSPASSYIAVLRDASDRAAKAELLVATVDGTVTGSVAYCPPGSAYTELAGATEAEFRMLAVRPGARRGGAGRAMVQACVDRALAAGLTALRLSTQANMHQAHRMYEGMGFTRTPGRDWSPVPDLTLLTYELVLVPSPAAVTAPS